MNNKTKIVNDQQHIIDALSVQDYMYVWQQVKYIGYKKEPNMNVRYITFCDIVEKFDYTRNNNFIYYYSSKLGFVKASKVDSFYVSNNRHIVHELISENVSPTECESSKLVKILKNWSN